jgi:hypothetical protein
MELLFGHGDHSIQGIFIHSSLVIHFKEIFINPGQVIFQGWSSSSWDSYPSGAGHTSLRILIYPGMAIYSWVATSRGGQTDDFRPLTYTLGEGRHCVQGQICDILTQASYESLPASWPHRFPYIRSMSSIRPICKCRCPPLAWSLQWWVFSIGFSHCLIFLYGFPCNTVNGIPFAPRCSSKQNPWSRQGLC